MGKTATENAFWAKARRGEPDECWLWTGACSHGGYGRTTYQGQAWYVHRLAWTLAHGPVPDDLMVCHTCDTRYPVGERTYRRCANPAHLFLATHDANMLDMVGKARQATGDRHGSRLHPERRPRGADHFAHAQPEKLARGERNGAHTQPERRPSGDRNGSRRHPERLPRGQGHWRAQLTEDEVRAIRARYAAGGISQQALGAAYGVGQSIISAILRRVAWSHVT